MEGRNGHNVQLLGIVNDATADELIRVAAVIAFKNSVKRNWRIVSTFKLLVKGCELEGLNSFVLIYNLCILKTECCLCY